MNFSKIIKMQKALDQAYAQNGALNESFIDKKRILAILVEIAEFANEYAPFKYWKNHKEINRNKVIEEFVDGIHFFATIINQFGMAVNNIKPLIVDQDQSIQLLYTFQAVANLHTQMDQNATLHAFCLYLGNAQLLGIRFDEIEDGYVQKNKINFERIKNGY